LIKLGVQKLFMFAGWLTLAFITFVTLSPIEDRLVVAGLQFEHFAAFALLGLLFALGYQSRTLLVVAVVLGSAFILEALQLLTPDRHGRVFDALVKAAGGLCGIGAASLGSVVLREQVNRIKVFLGVGKSPG